MSYHKAFFVKNHTAYESIRSLCLAAKPVKKGHTLSLPTSHQVTLGDGAVARTNQSVQFPPPTVLANQAEIRNARSGALGPFTIRLLGDSENLQNWEAQSPGPDSIGLNSSLLGFSAVGFQHCSAKKQSKANGKVWLILVIFCLRDSHH